MSLETVLFAFIYATIPALLWIWFWRREDREHPEPLSMIVLAFLAGVLAVIISIILEKLALSIINKLVFTAFLSNLLVFISWSYIEEVVKYLVARYSVLKSKENDEPVDAILYMIIVAIGFAAFENFLYFLTPFEELGINVATLYDGNLRFVGASLLHIFASSIVGAALSFSFYKKKLRKILLPTSLLVAGFVHFLFNYNLAQFDYSVLQVGAFVWLGLVGVLVIFEKIKRIKA